MFKIALVADKRTATCFRMAGLTHLHLVSNAQDAEECILELLKNDSIGIIIVTERLCNQIRETIERLLERRYPIIIPIPDSRGPESMKTDFLVELIRQKTGIELALH